MEKLGGTVPRHPKEPVVRAAFARVLAQARKEAEMKQSEVAEKSGYEEKYISALERRKHTPTLTAVIEISKAVNVSPLETMTKVLDLIPKFAHLENGETNPVPKGSDKPKKL
jgi:transcriptional regulator with XRE-family HTH domain